MSVGKSDFPIIHSVNGIRIATGSAGLYQTGRPDIVLIELDENTNCTAVFTRNAFCAAPVIIARQHLQSCMPRYCVINAGNANAGTGTQGKDDALSVCNEISKLAQCQLEAILPFSTGVIGELLPVDKITGVLPDLIANLSSDAWSDAATAMMTTDTRPKGISRKITLDGHEITITGIAKGSGMIRPDMATMLAFIATDACIDSDIMHGMLKYVVNQSFNCISVDGDTSTNDACLLIATGQSSLSVIDNINSEIYAQLLNEIREICMYLAKSIVKDGEGATKFITINIEGGETENECRLVAYTIANSPLVKTALFASDPNWGRILSAIGYAGVDNLDIELISVKLDDVCVVKNGARDPEYTESQGQEVMDKDEISISVDLNRGEEQTTIWTCDLSHDYVRINAEYRT